MRKTATTWARHEAAEEAYYQHPLTRTTLDFAAKIDQDMPDLTGIPPDVFARGAQQEQVADG
eukprot:9664420-Lingulodinium_polyedra.AAC.1